jgi:hypothetical protein
LYRRKAAAMAVTTSLCVIKGVIKKLSTVASWSGQYSCTTRARFCFESPDMIVELDLKIWVLVEWSSGLVGLEGN